MKLAKTHSDKEDNSMSTTTTLQPLTLGDFMALPPDSQEALPLLQRWRDTGLIAQLFPGFGNPPANAEEDSEDTPYVEDMQPAARFADIALNPRDRALLILLYLARKSRWAVVGERGQPEPALFERHPRLADVPGLRGRDCLKLEYVYSWICARHLGSFGLEQIQICSKHRYGRRHYGRLAAAYFKAVHYHERPNQALDQFLQPPWRGALGFVRAIFSLR